MEKLEQDRFVGSQYATVGYAPRDRFVFLQHHAPFKEMAPYHYHPAVEVNFLRGCDMTYSFSGHDVRVPRDRFCVFWAAHPHRVVDVEGEGLITNIYVYLSEFMKWPLPREFVDVLLSGAVICSKNSLLSDVDLAERWANETDRHSQQWQRLHAAEIYARLFRMGIDGWEVLLPARQKVKHRTVGGKAVDQFEKMLHFVADNFANPIKIQDVADEAGISERYAIMLFRKMLGRTVKEHINDTRMFHAKMLLSETQLKIVSIALDSGFPSLSAFYRAFRNYTGTSPDAFRNHAHQAEERGG